MRAFVLALGLFAAATGPAHSQSLSAEQIRNILASRPDLSEAIRRQIQASGLTADQVRSRLSATGYPASLLDPYLSTPPQGISVPLNEQVVAASSALGFLPGETPATTDTIPLAAPPSGAQVRFGMEVFKRATSQFQPSLAGPVDPSYRLGPGDALALILTGEVELTHQLEVSREGFIVIPQVGQLFVAGLNMSQLENLLYERLGRVYSSVRRGAGAATRFQVTVTRLRVNQVYVIGDVAHPGSYQIPAVGTVLTALYAAGGPTVNGSFRSVQVRRGSGGNGVGGGGPRTVGELDLYDYLIRGDNSRDIRLENGDVVFVPVRGSIVRVTGRVVRPAEYELKPGETLRELIASAGGFEATALQRRVQIDRILPPAQRQPGGRDRVVLDLGPEQFADGTVPRFALEPGDEVRVFEIAGRRRNQIVVRGAVWNEGPVGFVPGMRLEEAIRLAGGPKPDVYLDQILVSRLQPDSTRIQLRGAFADSVGAIRDNFPLQEDDEITVFARTTFRPARYVTVAGAVKRPGSVPFREGMTLRDAVLLAEGLTEDALLTEAEIARIPEDRSGGGLATTTRVPLDSTYLFDRGPNGEYLGPPGLAAQARGAPEVALEPYDNILVFRQPEWELHRTVRIEGQIQFPGTYALRTRTERLSDMIGRAGGLNREAYPAGIRFVRRSISQGRIGIDLPAVLRNPSHRDNLVLTAGDSIVIPEYIPVVRVEGAVNSPMAVAYVPGRDIDFYVASAGGYSRMGDKGKAFVTQANGKVESVKRRFLFEDTIPEPSPGAVVFVPQRDPSDKKDFVGLAASIAQILASTVAIIVVATR
ncbi:MAG: SLBB domain-containing protein [Gemmatimonadales bacterium]